MKIYIYRASSFKGMIPFWNNETQEMDEAPSPFISYGVVKDHLDNICLMGYDKDGNFQQFDSYEALHAYDWGHQHGIKVEDKEVEIDVDALFAKV